ncbi:MaoC family dehydratase [Chloroflexota bacterium]
MVTAVCTKDTPVGYELDGVKKQAAIQLMGSRHWGRVNPIHFDPVTAANHGLKAPIQTGQMSSAYLFEMCVNFFGENMFRNAHMHGKYVKPVYAGETITTHGIVSEKTPEGSGYRFKVELWADNQDGEVKTVSWVTAHVE